MKSALYLAFAATNALPMALAAQDSGTVTGLVTLEATGEPVHGAVVLLIGLGEFTTTDGEGKFTIEGVPAGTYELLVEREHLTADREPIEMHAGGTVVLSVSLALSPIHEEITVTTSAHGESTALEQFNAVTTLDSFELSKDMWGNLGEALQNEAGLAKRSFGSAPRRPIIRGFDGDRVLIMQDGLRTGDVSSQSADHNVTIDPASLERVEIIKGPATLLYGTNAVGGVVNAITPQQSFRRSRPQGFLGQAVLDSGTANAQLGGNANLRYGAGNWMLWGSGGSRRTGDYDTPEGTVENSSSALRNGGGGAGYFGDRYHLSVGYGIEDGRFGVPGAAALEGIEGGASVFAVDNDQRRQHVRVDTGVQDFRNNFIEALHFNFQFVDYTHSEIEVENGVDNVSTVFDNNVLLFRAEAEQNPSSKLTGRLGFWAKNRDFVSTGEEALAPPTTHNALAGFAFEELTLGPTTTLSFGGRVESNDYNPEPRADAKDEGVPEAIPRRFTGVSGALGFRWDFVPSAAFVTNVTRSYRAPALEELYNFGPHVGNLAFEIGNPNLEREATVGVDMGVKGRGKTVDADFNFFYYTIDNFVFPSFEDEIVDGLRLAPFRQSDSRFVGFDSQANFRAGDSVWIKAGFGFVDAKLTETDEHLPRIPPLHGRLEVEIPYRVLTITPELIWSLRQEKVFRDETTTDGYAVFNVKVQYTWVKTHVAHIFGVNAYNLTNELYRTHTNFTKDFAPEIGRGIKLTYSLRFF